MTDPPPHGSTVSAAELLKVAIRLALFNDCPGWNAILNDLGRRLGDAQRSALIDDQNAWFAQMNSEAVLSKREPEQGMPSNAWYEWFGVDPDPVPTDEEILQMLTE